MQKKEKQPTIVSKDVNLDTIKYTVGDYVVVVLEPADNVKGKPAYVYGKVINRDTLHYSLDDNPATFTLFIRQEAVVMPFSNTVNKDLTDKFLPGILSFLRHGAVVYAQWTEPKGRFGYYPAQVLGYSPTTFWVLIRSHYSVCLLLLCG